MPGDADQDQLLLVHLFQKWERLMRFACITDAASEGTDDQDRRRRNIRVNKMLVAWFLLASVRMGYSTFFTHSYHHLYGQTFVHLGNVASMAWAGVGTAYFQWMLHRVVGVWQLSTGNMCVMQTISSMTSEPIASLRRQKVQMARMVYMSAISGCIGFVACTSGYHTFLLWLNVQHSSSNTEITCWTFWWTQDMLAVAAAAVTLSLYPAAWILQALDYRLDLMYVSNCMRSLATDDHDGDRDPVKESERLDKVTVMMQKLSDKARQVNRSSAPFLFVVLLCAIPMSTICLFIAMYTDQVAVAITYGGVGGGQHDHVCIYTASDRR